MDRKISTIKIHIVHDEPGPGEFLGYLVDHCETKFRNRGALNFAYEVETGSWTVEEDLPKAKATLKAIEELVALPELLGADEEPHDDLFADLKIDPVVFSVKALEAEIQKHLRKRGKNKLTADDLALISKAESAEKNRDTAMALIDKHWQKLMGQ